MTLYENVQEKLKREPKVWVITGVAGFIGSNLLKKLLELDQVVVGVDNFVTGYQKNLNEIKKSVSDEQAARFSFIQGDICDLETCCSCCKGADIVLHQAALGSVPRSIEDPLSTHRNNVDGFVNMLIATRDMKVSRLVYASSSSVYGDDPSLPKDEGKTGRPLSPYAASKYINEIYSAAFATSYGMHTIGLRYFNVFGPRQDPNGAYAAVIPRWFGRLLKGEAVNIFGDGKTSRDFCYIQNVVQANILAACTENPEAVNHVYNIAVSQSTTLNNLYYIIRDLVGDIRPDVKKIEPNYLDFRPGDIRHSLANINKAVRLLGYTPKYTVKEGLGEAAKWYIENLLYS